MAKGKVKALSRLVGTPIPVELNGDTFTFSPITIEDFGELEMRIRAQRWRTWLEAHPYATKEEKAEIQDEFLTGMMRDGEMNAELGRPRNIIYSLWLSLRKHHPDVSYDEFNAAMSQHPELMTELAEKLAPINRGDKGDSADPTEGGRPPTGDTSSPSSVGTTE